MATGAKKPSASGSKRVRKVTKKSVVKKKVVAKKRGSKEVVKKISEETVEVPRVRSAPRSVPASAPAIGGFVSTTSVRAKDVTVFLRQLIMMLDAGTPLLKSLNSLAERGRRSGVRGLIKDIAQYVENGNPLWQAFERHPRYFDTVFVNLIKASEASGTLTTVMRRMVEYREKRDLLRKRVAAAMLYPIILVVACGVVMFVMVKMVIPELEGIFTSAGVEIDGSAAFFIGSANFLGKYWLWLLIVAGAVIAVYKLWYVRNPLRRLTADKIKLKLPVIGPILRKNSIVEFTRTMSLMLSSGLSMMASLELVRSVIYNRAVAQVIQDIRDSVERGAGIEEPLRDSEDVIPSVVTDMLVTGEESGQLDTIAAQIADTYEEEVKISIAALGEALQPILTVIIGVMVGGLVFSLFGPIIKMMEKFSSGGAM